MRSSEPVSVPRGSRACSTLKMVRRRLRACSTGFGCLASSVPIAGTVEHVTGVVRQTISGLRRPNRACTLQAFRAGSRPLFVFLVETRFEFRMRPAHLVHHAPGPVEIFALALERPARRRRAVDVADI